MLQELSYAQWQEFECEGYLHLGRCLTDDELAAMQQRMDDIMLGTAPVDYDRMMMQLDRIPGKTTEPGPGTKGHKGATLFYRKIQDLEFDPLITIWTALDPATVANGCVHIAPRRHHAPINPTHSFGFITGEQVQTLAGEAETIPFEMDAGKVVLLHNYLPQSSGVNSTSIARRAFSVCHMDAATVDFHNHEYSLIFGDGVLDPEQL